MIKIFLENDELIRFEFVSPFSGTKFVSTRGRNSINPDSGNFPFSKAVTELTRLLIGFSEDPKYSIDSSSLDYALGKPPRWLFDLFGELPSGKCASGRLFVRENPEGKRYGAVTIRVNDLLVKPSDILIIGKESSFLNSDSFKQALRKQFNLAYCNTDPISNPNDVLLRTISHPSFSRYARKNVELIHPTLLDCYPSQKRGVMVDAACLNSLPAPLKIASNAPLLPAQALFKLTQKNYPVSLDVNYSFPHALEVGDRIVKSDWECDPPHLAILGIGPASYVIRNTKHDFVPLMPFLFSFDEMVGTNAKESAFTFICDNPSTSLFYFERLAQSGLLTKGLKPIHNEPWDAIRLAIEDPLYKAILFFPYNEVAKLEHKLKPIAHGSDSGTLSEMFLFAHKSLISNKRGVQALATILRDSFYRIREDSFLRESLMQELLTDQQYMKVLRRFAKAA